MVLSDYEKDQLKKMIEANDTKDMTNKIRENKHSIKLKEGIESIIKLRNENMEMYINDKNEFEKLVLNTDSFLFNNYIDIYNKIMKNEVDIKILNKFLDLLKQIEDGRLDQHEASFKIGKLLKEMYIDSALKQAEKNEKKDKKKPPRKEKKISWDQFKQMNVGSNGSF